MKKVYKLLVTAVPLLALLQAYPVLAEDSVQSQTVLDYCYVFYDGNGNFVDYEYLDFPTQTRNCSYKTVPDNAVFSYTESVFMGWITNNRQRYKWIYHYSPEITYQYEPSE